MLAAPFALEDLKKIVSGETSDIEINFDDSKIKNQALLTYIYNLNISTAKINMASTSFEDRRNFFLSYANHKTTVEVSNLIDTYLKFLLSLKKITVHSEDLEEINFCSIFSDHEIDTLLDTDPEIREVIERAAFVLDGIVVHIMLSLNDINIQGDEEFGKVGILNDPTWIGHTWVNLLKNPVFNAYYYTVMPSLKDLVYFPYQYCESIYKGKVLLDYLSEHPWLMALMQVSIKNLERTQDHDDSPSV